MQKRHWESGAMTAPVSDGENKRFTLRDHEDEST
jgi:hypothetical protein